MKIIMLKGASNTGKTTTINLVAEELVRQQGAIVIEGKMATGKVDCCCILEQNKLKIGIVTGGDIGCEVIYRIGYYEGRSVDVLIIANSNRALAKNMAEKKGSPCHIVDKIVANDADNDRAKNDILKLI